MLLSQSKFPLALIIFLVFNTLSAQFIPGAFKRTTDSLISEAPKTYKELNDVLRPNRRDTTLMKYFIRESIKRNYLDGPAYAYNQLGTKYRNISKYKRAIELHQQGLDIADQAGNIEFRILNLNMLGVVYRRLNAIKTALDYNQEALELAETIEQPSNGIKRSINVSVNSIGNIYQELEQFDRAIEHFKKSMDLEEQLGNVRGLAINHQNIGECLESQGKLDEALQSYRIALAYDEEIASNSGVAICKNSVARIYIKQDKPKDALNILEPTLVISEDTGDKHIISAVLMNMGWALMKLKRYAEAEIKLLAGLKMSREHNLRRNMSESYALLSQLAEERGEYKKSLEYLENAEELEDLIYNNTSLSYVNDVIFRYDTDKKNSEIEALKRTNELKDMKLKRNRTTLMVSALLLALFTLILYILYRQYQLKSEKKMLTLEQSMLRSQMNPHFLFNSLNSIKLYIINNEKKNAVHYLNKFSKLVRKILEASSLKEIPLAEELETVDLYMNIENIRFSNEINFEIKVDEEIDTHLVKIPSLILQPFLENALWHGLSSKEGDKRIEIQVSKGKNGFINISISDNGVGRAMAEKLKQSKVLKRKSVGIDITKERLANFSKDFQNNFDVEIIDLFEDDGKAAGTKVVLHIPTI
ncbi:MAG: tetratricopeptide repeat protein [Flavobacteriaceae bacterium]